MQGIILFIIIVSICIICYIYYKTSKDKENLLKLTSQVNEALQQYKNAHNFAIVPDKIPIEDIQRDHPVLKYQRKASYDTWPANYGDPIRIPDVAGPVSFNKKKAYDINFPGPIPGKPMGVPVPRDTMRSSNPLGIAVTSVDTGLPFFSEVDTPWQKIGLLTSKNEKGEILNLYGRPIAPNQELYEYQVQDKNGFVIPLERTSYLEDGDIIYHVMGKEKQGPWRANIFNINKYVYF